MTACPVEQFSYIVNRHVRRFGPPGGPEWEDLWGAGTAALVEAISRYDPTKGDLTAYASVAVRRAVVKAHRQYHGRGNAEQAARVRAQEAGRPPDDMARFLAPPDSAPDAAEQVVDRQICAELVAQLPPRQRFVVSAYFGLGGIGPFSTVEIARMQKTSRQSVSRTLRIALRSLRRLAADAGLGADK